MYGKFFVNSPVPLIPFCTKLTEPVLQFGNCATVGQTKLTAELHQPCLSNAWARSSKRTAVSATLHYNAQNGSYMLTSRIENDPFWRNSPGSCSVSTLSSFARPGNLVTGSTSMGPSSSVSISIAVRRLDGKTVALRGRSQMTRARPPNNANIDRGKVSIRRGSPPGSCLLKGHQMLAGGQSF